MNRSFTVPILLFIFSAALFTGCGNDHPEDLLLYTNATIWDGTGQNALPNSALITQNGRVLNIIDMNDPDYPEGAETVDLDGRYIIPGMINAHGHVGMADGLQTGPDVHSVENVIDQLRLYAAYGITTVVSLGDEPAEAFTVRDRGAFAENGMARLYLAGDVLNPDWTKIRVDDGLGSREKMQADVYSTIIDVSHEHSVPLAAHIIYLEDAKGILQNNGDLIAHSIRDEPVDSELIDLMLEQDICITPTLTREVSTYIYAERPDFFDDPFFLQYADEEVIGELQQSEVQQRFTGQSADYFREALPIAKENMMDLHNRGIRIAMGTDSGPPARFQGYFEHMEMEMMQEAGMTPREILTSATRYAAECMQINEELGTLEEGKLADFVVLEEDPFVNIRNLREISGVYMGGIQITDVAN